MTQPTRRPKERKEEILSAALEMSRAVGYLRVTREQIALRAHCSPAAVSAHFGTMTKLRRAIMSAAVARKDLVIIAQGLVADDSKARAVTSAVRFEALGALL